MTERASKARVVAVAGGKGGAGKSLLAANIGIFLATLGRRVVLIDAALGMANLHAFTGLLRPERTLAEALGPERVPLAELASMTPVPGLQLVAGQHDPYGIASPEPEAIAALLAQLPHLAADYVVLDLAPGTAPLVVELFLAAHARVVVAVPEPTSVELCYRFLRTAFQHELRVALGDDGRARDLLAGMPRRQPGIPAPIDCYSHALEEDPELAFTIQDVLAGFRPQLVINAARSKADMEMGRAMASAVRRQLGVPMGYLGHLEYDEAVWVAVRRRRPLLVEHPEARVSKCVEKVTRQLLAVRDGKKDSVLVKDSYYDLLEVAPTASFEDIRRANRRIRELYSGDSVVISGLYSDRQLDEFHRQLDVAYGTLMDAARRKEYDAELFPGGVPAAHGDPPLLAAGVAKLEPAPAVERPPMPTLHHGTSYTGPLMQQIREAKGIELREIAERTKIGMTYLEAIEAEAFKKLPAVVYVRGFLVEYAKMLGLDSDRVLETYLERYRAARRKSESQPGEAL